MILTALALALALAPALPAADTVTPRASASLPPPELEAGYAREELGGGREAWEEWFARARHHLRPRLPLSVDWLRTRRFGLVDDQGRVGAALPLGTRSSLELELTAAPGARVLPRWAVGARLHRELGAGWVLGAGARDRTYADARVRSAELLAERYLGAFRVAYRFSLTRLDRESPAPGHALSGSVYYGDRSSLTLGLGAGREVERIDADQLRSIEGRSASLWGTHSLSSDLALLYALGLHRQSDLYDRRRALLGLRLRL